MGEGEGDWKRRRIDISKLIILLPIGNCRLPIYLIAECRFKNETIDNRQSEIGNHSTHFSAIVPLRRQSRPRLRLQSLAIHRKRCGARSGMCR